MRGQSRTEIAQKEPAHGFQWNREGHPDAIPREQAQVKSKNGKAKTECQNREEWGHHAPNRRVMETSSKGRARTRQLVGRCRVEEQTVAVVTDYDLTRNAETQNASSGLVKVH